MNGIQRLFCTDVPLDGFCKEAPFQDKFIERACCHPCSCVLPDQQCIVFYNKGIIFAWSGFHIHKKVNQARWLHKKEGKGQHKKAKIYLNKKIDFPVNHASKKHNTCAAEKKK